MVLRQPKSGRFKGQEFFGCVNFPLCHARTRVNRAMDRKVLVPVIQNGERKQLWIHIDDLEALTEEARSSPMLLAARQRKADSDW